MPKPRLRSASVEAVHEDTDLWSADFCEMDEDEEEVGPIRAVETQHSLPDSVESEFGDIADEHPNDESQETPSTGCGEDLSGRLSALQNGAASAVTIEPWEKDNPSSKRGHKRRTLGSSWWWWELVAALLSTTCIFLIVTALLNMDGQPLSRWSLAISPNAVISVLTTVAKSALLFVVAECISQLKWLHFNQAHALSDLQAFDEASRGPWGSFAFLWRKRGSALIATIGCVITIASLGFEPTAQQILDFPLRKIVDPGEVAQIRVASQFHLDFDSVYLKFGPIRGRSPGPATPPLPIQLAILAGLIGQTNEVEHNCSTSHCHFDDVSSLGICASCEDLTPALAHECTYDPVQFVLAGGREDADSWSCRFRTGDAYAGSPKLLGYMTFYETDLVALLAEGQTLPPVLSVRAAVGGSQYNPYKDKCGGFGTLKRQKTRGGSWFSPNVSQTSNALVEAEFCTWQWCERRYENLSIIDGTITYDTETTSPLLPVHPRNLTVDYEWNISDDVSLETYELKPVDSSAPERSYYVDWGSELSVFAYLTALLHKNLTNGHVQEGEPQPDPILQIVDGQNVTKVAHDIALALSHAMRTSVNTNATLLNGSALRQDTFVSVRWPWLVFPMSLTVLGVVLLVLAIAENEASKTLLLKSSALAALFHPLEGFTPDEMAVRGSEDAGALSRGVGGVKVRLRGKGKGVLGFEKVD